MKVRAVYPAIALLLFSGLLPAADQQLMNLLMPDAKVLAGVNVDQAKNSPFGQFMLSRLQAGEDGLGKLTGATGFDPRRDLREILMGTVGQPGQKGLVLARGTFDTTRIFDAARSAGQTVENYKGVDILTGKEDSSTHALAFLDGSIAIAGDLDNVHGAIDRRSGNNSLDPALAAKVGLLSTSLDAWSVSTVPMAALANEKLPDTKLNGLLNSDVLKTVTQTSGGIKFGAMIQFSAEAVARSDKDATALADVVRFLGNMLQANAPTASAAAVTSLIQSLDVKTDGNTVKLALAIPEDQLEKLMQSIHGKGTHASRSRL
ncbi:MAG: hypothetical protein JWO48_2564 [Bryobacterales bacterium]|nr:hypothetical protein [Bryobacterales bacterium]